MPPSAPRSLKATAGFKMVRLTWKAPSSTGGARISSYKVYRSVNGKKYTLINSLSARQFTVAKLQSGKRYWFKVLAVNSVGRSALTKAVAVRPR
jgi:predicted phage tail protein